MSSKLRESCLDPIADLGRQTIWFYNLSKLHHHFALSPAQLPITIRILAESLLRRLGSPGFDEAALMRLLAWLPHSPGNGEFPFMPARVLLQDFTGVPCMVDLAALRSALHRMGLNPGVVEPQIPVDLVIDHSVQLDQSGCAAALKVNLAREFERNGERYEFLRWAQKAFRNLKVLPPGLGICHQVNMEYLATCVRTEKDELGRTIAYPDSVVGTDSHTVMINSMGVLGWGVGGIEAEAAMLGQPIPMLPPSVTGVRLVGRLPATANATDLALTVTSRLRELGVVGHFVEFFGPGVDTLSLADRAPTANMAPEYGATMGYFPIDQATLRYLRDTGRDEERVALVEAVARAQGLWRAADYEPRVTALEEIDLSSIRATVAGPRRPQERQNLEEVPATFKSTLELPAPRGFGESQSAPEVDAGALGTLSHGSVVIAAITSCTNTSNPSLLLDAALLARNAVRRGLRVAPHVKTSFAPGSRAVTAYLDRLGMLKELEALGFHVAAYGCTTCIGNSGPLDAQVAEAIRKGSLVAAAVLSGNRNFEGRIHPLTRANYLCSPTLVVAYALAGNMLVNLESDPLGTDSNGRPVFFRELLPTPAELAEVVGKAVKPEEFRAVYLDIEESSPQWNALPESSSAIYPWDQDSTYIREPPYVQTGHGEGAGLEDIEEAALLAVLGDFITTDHISPAGAIEAQGAAAAYLRKHGVSEDTFNSYGSRRGNHEVMWRGTFANTRLRNLKSELEGGWTRHDGSGQTLSIFDAAERYRQEGVPLIVLAGKMYGAGSSRDWAAKGVRLLGVRGVIAESFERIHRSNLVGMGVLPLEFAEGTTAQSLGLKGTERISIRGIKGLTPGAKLTAEALTPDGHSICFTVCARVDTPMELEFLRMGGILPHVLAQLAARAGKQ